MVSPQQTLPAKKTTVPPIAQISVSEPPWRAAFPSGSHWEQSSLAISPFSHPLPLLSLRGSLPSLSWSLLGTSASSLPLFLPRSRCLLFPWVFLLQDPSSHDPSPRSYFPGSSSLPLPTAMSCPVYLLHALLMPQPSENLRHQALKAFLVTFSLPMSPTLLASQGKAYHFLRSSPNATHIYNPSLIQKEFPLL